MQRPEWPSLLRSGEAPEEIRLPFSGDPILFRLVVQSSDHLEVSTPGFGQLGFQVGDPVVDLGPMPPSKRPLALVVPVKTELQIPVLEFHTLEFLLCGLLQGKPVLGVLQEVGWTSTILVPDVQGTCTDEPVSPYTMLFISRPWSKKQLLP